MSKSRPFGVTLLAILAVLGAIVAAYHTLQFLGLLPIQFGVFKFFSVNWLGAIMWGVLALIYLWVARMLWNLDPRGWLFVSALSALNLILAILSIIGQSTWQAMLPSIVVNGLILIYSQLSGTKAAFGVAAGLPAEAPPAAPSEPAPKAEAAPPAPEAEVASAEPAPEVAAAAAVAVEAAVEAEAPPEEPPQEPPQEPPAAEAAMPAMEEEAEEAEEPEAELLTGAAALASDLSYVEGVGEVYAGKLKEVGVESPQDLLERGATPEGREELAEATGISEHLILKWVDAVDLYRIKGLGSQYAELLRAAGVSTVLELAQRKPENLYAKIIEVNEERRHVRRAPSQSQVEDWVGQAKELPRIVSY